MRIFLVFLILGVFCIPVPAAALGGGYELYDGTNMDVWVYVPLDFWYIPNGEGSTMNPIVVKAEGHSYTSGYKYVPNELTVHVWAHDREWDTYADWFHLADYNILTTYYGTTIDVEGHAGVSGDYGDGKTYSIGGELGVTWSVSGTPENDLDFSQYEYHMALYQHLGSVWVDMLEDSGWNFVRYGVGLQIAIANSEAPSYDYHRYTFKVEVTMVWSSWNWIWLVSTHAASQTQTFYVGDDTPSSDTLIYLLPAQDYDISQS